MRICVRELACVSVCERSHSAGPCMCSSPFSARCRVIKVLVCARSRGHARALNHGDVIAWLRGFYVVEIRAAPVRSLRISRASRSFTQASSRFGERMGSARTCECRLHCCTSNDRVVRIGDGSPFPLLRASTPSARRGSQGLFPAPCSSQNGARPVCMTREIVPLIASFLGP